MNTNHNHMELRHLLEGWYAARLSPTEETRLYDLLSDAGPLPEDLEDDRSMILAIREAAAEPVEIPADKARRIEAALEHEMAAGRIVDAATGNTHSGWRRWLWQGAAAVAVLAIGATFFLRTDHNNTPGTAIARLNNTTPDSVGSYPLRMQAIEDSVTTEIPFSVANQPSDNIARTEKPAKKHHARHRARRQVAPHEADEYEETETRLMATNYHVVTEQREADAMLGAIFGRLESQMTAESVKMAEISGDYQSEMTKLSLATTIN